MLQFNPNDRITVDEALAHPYLASLHKADDEPTCPTKYNGDWEKGYGEEIPKNIQQQILQSDLQFFEEKRKHTVTYIYIIYYSFIYIMNSQKQRRNPGLLLSETK